MHGTRWFTDKCVEPEKRMIAGRYGWAVHRFPIRGGRTMQETVFRDAFQKLALNVLRNNALLQSLKASANLQ